MLLTANEGRQQHSFFIPQLGPAPKWCSFLDNLVEEMAEDPNDPNAFASTQAGAVYDNFKFLTVPQLRTLNLEHLIGRTNLLRPYMHGYFVGQRLYEEARLIANPYVWEEERAKRVKEKIDKERESRIRGKKKATVKVNKKLAERLMNAEEKAERKRARDILQRGGDADMVDAPAEGKDKPEASIGDSRFAKLFEDEDFAVDETSREFQLLNPSTVPQKAERGERGLTAVEQEAADDTPGSSDDDSDSDGEREQERPAKPQAPKKISSTDYKRTRKAPPRMQVSSSARTNNTRDRSFGSRAQNMKSRARPSRQGGAVGEREVSFMPASKSKKDKPEVQYDKTSSSSFRSKERRSASNNAFRGM